MMSNRTHSKRAGFTLVELMAATAIAGAMVVVTMGTLVNLSSQVKFAKEEYHSRPWLAVLKKQLQVDFAHSRSILVKPDAIQIDGYSWIEPASGQLNQIPTSVVYRLEPGSKWLLRTQQQRLGNSSTTSKSVVCSGIQSFQDLSDLQLDVPPGVWRLRLELVDEDGQTETVDWALHRHGAFTR